MEKVTLKLSNDEATALLRCMENSILKADYLGTKNREKLLILAAVKEVHKRLSTMVYEFKHKYTITLSIVQSQGLWLAYYKGYMYSNNLYDKAVLSDNCDKIHQLTS